MKEEHITDALNILNDDIIEEASKVRSNAKPTRKWVKWGVMAACLCIAIVGIITIRQQSREISFSYVESPALVSLDEEPKMQREDLKNILVNNIVVRGTVRDCSYLRIEAGNSTWYITTINVDIDQVIRGGVDTSTISIVSAQCYTDTDIGEQFPVQTGLADCVSGTEGVFAISNVPEDSTWDIGNKRVSVKEFGNYFYRIRCSLQDDSIVYGDSILNINEVKNA